MTTDATPETPEPDRPRPAQIRAGDYPDPREQAQRAADGTTGATQSAALTDSGPDPHQQVDQLIEQIQQLREQAAALLEDPPVLVDVIRRGGPPDGSGPDDGPPDHPDPGLAILVVRGELLLRVPAGTPVAFDREAAVRAGDQADAWQRAILALENLRYTTPPVHDRPRGQLPLLTFSKDVHGPDELVRDRDAVRTAAPGAEVDLNYVVTAGHTVKAADYPVPAATHRCYSPEWIRRHPVRRTINVAVIDTGINHLSRTDGWLTGIAEDASNEDPLDVFPVRNDNGVITRGDHLLDVAAGHGTFVSGVVEQVAPLSGIRVYRSADTLGWATSDVIGNALIRAATDGADIINASLGTMTVDDLPPLAFTLALEMAQAAHPGVLVVASAGNMGLDTPMFPAAMKGVVGVGALDSNLNPAPWSGNGFWVDCSAIGVGVTSTFVKGVEPARTADGTEVDEQFGDNAWAIWSGTSFSAPQIAGAVAQLCQLNGVEPAQALDQLLTGRSVRPGYGFVVPILPGS